ncbi:MAG: alpha-D-ribose 1-methylphosphonate 5-triphosphate diphosphatase [Pseudomonadota bacterium]|jgi:alpha-D-ribose 1-methylphosphonate 5-triphosphate diphosphatase|uniref:Alpha-D-ribose 1-methylphosphonate 5-triphosphate diphosphatase n=1 Tax=Actibacterium naphthalenivorans TaxID=1614693 RepID=A0A840CIU9_9RHOB|nr:MULTISPECIES: alpha-D-ribose 1-methylphosphonate 5-triphosphate diphosphatase [Actibacterium]ALG90679.1 alkylphosphonate utilization protein [Actibacterium sp. EMB200-NS6]KGB81687.1 alkylphosphonate utilization protein [Rhodovulum sp. NI22]MBB4023129.1 alpha-D-ribose 1-methylphosphonate 5-triphosphate diphosphatase [Actibacterium naphthalenivorans]MDY6859538.1 alpha-D-ribose 1-methylphosphonate 5-triphosphate diphosphatase [Pseudomonadota bacterium]|tara:strand:- start:446 stop:1627 length:1182 start_codon:yes stop_codon:yes gene_type:complete
MPQVLHPLRFTGATILRDGELQQRSLAIADGRITKGPLPEVDLSGYLILPGIIDLHGDAFERHIAPRPSAPFDLPTGLASTDRDAAANGVTTAWLAQSWSWEGGHRGPERAEEIMAALSAYRNHALTDLRLQVRCETHLVDSGPRLLAAIRRHGIDYVVFNNHLEEAVDHARERPEVIYHWARQAGRTPDEHMTLVNGALARAREVPRHLCSLAEAFDEMGVLYGSHDDPDGETRERYSMIGARIAEFPTSRKAAAAAKAMNDPVLMGAPNVMRGGSQSGNIAAMDLIHQGLCDALVSDYYYPALAGAAWRLVDEGVMGLPAAWAMISQKPAEILRLPDRGRLDFGKRADLCVINRQTRRIEMTIAGGRLSFLSGEAAHRFSGRITALNMAAE